MTIRQFRRLNRAHRRQIIDNIEDPLTARVLRAAFLGPGKRSWVQVALIIGGRQHAEHRLPDCPPRAATCHI